MGKTHDTTPAVVLIVVLLAVLTLASSAWADCAWVLWMSIASTNPTAPPGGFWEPAASHDFKAECEDMTRRLTEKLGGARTDRSGYKYIRSYVCLPDTVDPRGPKGK